MEISIFEDVPTVLLFFILFYLFIIIGIAASDFFCVNLSTATYHLPTSVATILLSIANASPDIFSTFTASTNNGFNLALGELIGSAAFVSTMICGCIGLVNPHQLHPSFYTKHILLFVILLIMIDIFMELKTLPIGFSILSLCYYFIYVLMVWHHPTAVSETNSVNSAISEPIMHNLKDEDHHFIEHMRSLPILITDEDLMPLLPVEEPSKTFVYLKRGLYYLSWPAKKIVGLICPIVTRMDCITDEDSFTYSQVQSLSWPVPVTKKKIQGFFGFLLVLLLIYSWFDVPLIRLTILIAILASLGISLFIDQLPHTFILWFGVIVSAVIVQFSANLMVSCLKVLCDRLNLSQGLVGMTIFALGNSLGDLITNISLANMGHVHLATSATLSSPLLCLSIGLGASTMYLNTHPTGEIHVDKNILWTLRFLIGTLIGFIILLQFYKFKLNRVTSGYLVICYCCIITCSVLLG
eukprot:NODE_681_length_4794_cov_0.887114.p1 type:complete len:468 gc:universal NODE_681_length_4794_cov_0.887114:395-1798(+)